jgi:hypothetical protein
MAEIELETENACIGRHRLPPKVLARVEFVNAETRDRLDPELEKLVSDISVPISFTFNQGSAVSVKLDKGILSLHTAPTTTVNLTGDLSIQQCTVKAGKVLIDAKEETRVERISAGETAQVIVNASTVEEMHVLGHPDITVNGDVHQVIGSIEGTGGLQARKIHSFRDKLDISAPKGDTGDRKRKADTDLANPAQSQSSAKHPALIPRKPTAPPKKAISKAGRVKIDPRTQGRLTFA